MGNAPTKERPRSSSVSSSTASGGYYHHGGWADTRAPSDSHAATAGRRASRSSVLASSSDFGSTRETGHHRHSTSSRSKGKGKYKEETYDLVLDPSQTVDGGYLQPQGVYQGPYNFNYPIVRQLIIDRRLAPFYKGLDEFDPTWTDRQLLAAVRGLPLADDGAEKSEEATTTTPQQAQRFDMTIDEKQDTITIPDGKLALTSVSNTSAQGGVHSNVLHFLPSEETTTNLDNNNNNNPAFSSSSSSSNDRLPVSTSPPIPFPSIESRETRPESGSEDDSLHELADQATSLTLAPRSRAHSTSAVYTTTTTNNAIPTQVPPEVVLYTGAIECPICFLFYPKLLNLTRCCAQPICTECFVEIKRPLPHPPHDLEQEAQAGGPSTAAANAPRPNHLRPDMGLISEPACCPYCMTPDMGVTFFPSPYRTGIEANKPATANTNRSVIPIQVTSTASTSSSPSMKSTSTGNPQISLVNPATKRRGSVPASSPEVITTDQIRPEWSMRLAAARAHAARKSAAATAIHTYAFYNESDISASGSGNVSVSGGRSGSGAGGRPRDPFWVRSASSSSATREAGHPQQQSYTSNRRLSGSPGASQPALRSMLVDPTQGQGQGHPPSRRLQDLEEMMFMEAVRLSLLEEESRKRKTSETAASAAGE